MDEAQARARLAKMVAAAEAPKLTDDELGLLLAAHAVTDAAGNRPTNVGSAPAWAPATAYTAGTVVRAGGRWWRVLVPGTSGATAPGWPILTGFATEQLVDDGTLTWVDNGGAWAPTWDLNAAAAEGWRWKEAATASRFDFTTDGQQFRRAQVAAHCRQMAATYAGRRAGSIPLA